jgi:hypothetical protein
MEIDGLIAYVEWLIASQEGRLKSLLDRIPSAKLYVIRENLAKYRSWYKILVSMTGKDKQTSRKSGNKLTKQTAE